MFLQLRHSCLSCIVFLFALEAPDPLLPVVLRALQHLVFLFAMRGPHSSRRCCHSLAFADMAPVNSLVVTQATMATKMTTTMMTTFLT